MTTAIELKQAPVISHQLAMIGQSVSSRLNELNLDALVATEDTVKSLKQLRADLNKELKDYEDQRKFIKEAVNKPFKDFEETYKLQISDKYSDAINKLKDKIEVVESKIKDEKKANVVAYFTELCLSENIDFLKFENVGLDINLSTTEKAYKEKCNDFVAKVNDDIALIKSETFEAEIMVEYKKTLNASQAITTVRKRKDDEKAELDRIKQAETSRREAELRKLNMFYADLTKTFNWVKDESVFIKNSDVENLSKEDFSTKLIEIESRIKEKVAADLATQAFAHPSNGKEKPIETAPIIAPVISEPLKAPVQVVTTSNTTVPEELVTASFSVETTMTKLKGLVNYAKENGITLKNND